jgi:hypothetical protein
LNRPSAGGTQIHGSGSSSGRAWTRNRISSTITDFMVMALRHDRGRSGVELFGHRPDLIEQLGHPVDELVDLGEQEFA